MRPNEIFERAVVTKTITKLSPHTKQHDAVIILKPEDTLKLVPGKYFYSVRLNLFQHGHYCQHTLIPERMFFIKE